MQLPNSTTQAPSAHMPTQPLSDVVVLSDNIPNAGSLTAHTEAAVDTADLGHSVTEGNLSSIKPPLPQNLVEPPPTPRTYTVFTAGKEVGIADGRRPIDTSDISSLPYFSMRKFANWDSAHRYYSQRFGAGEIYMDSSSNPHAAAAVAPIALSTGAAALASNDMPSAAGPPTATAIAPIALPGGAPLAPGNALSGTPADTSCASAPAPVTAITAPAPVAAVTAPAPASSTTAAALVATVTVPAALVATVTVPAPVATVNVSSAAAAAIPAYAPVTGTNPTSGPPPPGIIPAPTGASPIDLASPFGRSGNPIFVSSAFPTPIQAIAEDEHPLAIDKLLPPSSRLQQTIQAARLSPTSGRSSKSSTYNQQTSGSSKSSAATRIKCANKGKGKADGEIDHLRQIRGRGRGPVPRLICYDDSDENDLIPGPSYPKTRSSTRVNQVVNVNTTPVPSITFTTPPAPAPALVVVATALAETMPQTPPNKRQRMDVPQVGLSPTPTPDANAEYNRLVQDASKTPKSATGSARRLALIKQALAMEAPGPSSLHAMPASQVISPETDYGLDSDMEPGFLEEASIFLDQGYTRE